MYNRSNVAGRKSLFRPILRQGDDIEFSNHGSLHIARDQPRATLPVFDKPDRQDGVRTSHRLHYNPHLVLTSMRTRPAGRDIHGCSHLKQGFSELFVIPEGDAEQSLEQLGVMPSDGMRGIQDLIDQLGFFDDRLVPVG